MVSSPWSRHLLCRSSILPGTTLTVRTIFPTLFGITTSLNNIPDEAEGQCAKIASLSFAWMSPFLLRKWILPWLNTVSHYSHWLKFLCCPVEGNLNIIRLGSFTWKLTELSSTPENILAALNFRALPSVPDTHHLEPITLAVTGSTVITARTLAGGRSVTDCQKDIEPS